MSKERPRLADHALVRRHLRDGDEIAVIHDARTGALCSLPPRLLDLVLLADGTRDLEGVALAASRAGLYTRLSEIQSTLDELDELGLMDEGVEPGPLPIAGAGRAESAGVPLEHLPGYTFACSGRGACCRQYASVALTAADLVRAGRAGLATLPGDDDARRVVLPLYGGVRTERVAMTLVDGRCLQLTSGGRCGLEVRGGADAKPTACRTYPAALLDVGDAVRVSVSCECDCVFESLGRPGAALVDARVAADLPEGVAIPALPETVALSPALQLDRVAGASWSRAIVAAVAPERVLEASVRLASSLDGGGGGEWPEVADAATEERDVLFGELTKLATRMEAAALSAESWRGSNDHTRIARRSIATVAREIAADRARFDAVLEDELRARDEAFTVRAIVFGHAFAAGEDVATGLRTLAARLLVARGVGVAAPQLGHPIAVVMAAMRGVGG